jgi:CBS domain containing-hemolysin-like protein
VSVWLTWLLLGVFLFLSGVFAGGETGLYSLSRTRLEAGVGDAHQRSADVIRRLVRDDTGLLITLLLANNLVNQAATLLGGRLVDLLPLPVGTHELVLTLLLTPPLFFLGELLPKDLFRRRPHTLVGYVAPGIAVTKAVLAPLTLPLRALTGVLARLLGLDAHELARVQGREAVLELLREHDRSLPGPMESMARNVLELRGVRVERVMVPWRRVETLAGDLAPGPLVERVGSSPFTRLPVVGPRGAVQGYLHQLEVLAAPAGTALARHLRPILSLEPSTPLDRALARLRQTGQRTALVGSPEAPLGLVTLKDLVEEISGELHRW